MEARLARKTKQEAEATRAAILESAALVFVRKGVARASLEEVAKEAGVTRGAVYWHFKNKQDLFKALYDQLYTPFTEMILSDLEQDPPKPLEQLAKLCTQLFLDLAANPQKKRILTIFFLKCDYTGEMEEIRLCQNERKAQSIKLFSEYFRRAQAKGNIPADANAHVLTLALLSYCTGLTYEYLRNPEVFDLEQHAPLLIQYFFSGIARQ